MKQEVLWFVSGIIGVVIHSLVKFQSLREDARVANDPLTFKKYWNNDFVVIILSFLTIPLWYIILPEILSFSYFKSLDKAICISFFGVGAVGSYALQYGLGKTKGLIRKTIDDKTNQLDELINNKNNKMEYWDLEFQNETDEVEQPTGNKTLGEFAYFTSGTLSGVKITYNSQPSFASVNVQPVGGKLYVATPTRRPV